MIWCDSASGDVTVANDGLGHALLYEYRNDHLWALTDRPMALAALGVALEPEPAEWAVRASLGWFPLNMTGFRRLSYVGPGTSIRISPAMVETRSHDVVSEWVHADPEADGVQQCVSELLSYTASVGDVVEDPIASLSGGRDSRAVIALLAGAGVAFTAKVRGPEAHADVVVARRLSDLEGFRLVNIREASVPPGSADEAVRRILAALLWQGGGRNAHAHKTFQSQGGFADGGLVGATGQHGEIGRSHYLEEIRKKGLTAATPDDALFALLMRRRPSFVRPSLIEVVDDAVRESIRQADRYDLRDEVRLDFMYLFERTRRWAAIAQASTPGLSIAPFIAPAFIRAAYAYRGDKTTNPFHEAILRRTRPAWIDIPYADEIPKPTLRAPSEGDHWKVPGRRRFYDTKAYWDVVGRPVLERLLREDGFWSEVFDPDLARAQWRSEPDELAVVCLLPEAIAAAARG